MSQTAQDPEQNSTALPTSGVHSEYVSNAVGPNQAAGETSYITPRPSTSASPPRRVQLATQTICQEHEWTHRGQEWCGRGRTPWRVGDAPGKWKRTSTAMPEGDVTASKRVKRGAKAVASDSSKSEDPFARLTWTTRTPSPSQSRKASPTRNLLHELRTVRPKVTVNEHYDTALPLGVHKVVEHLRTSFSDGDGTIPLALKANLQNTNAPEIQGIKPSAYNTTSTLDAHSLDQMWKEVERVYLNAKECSHWGKDENAWSDEVVRLVLAWGDAEDFFEVLNIKTQNLYSYYLPKYSDGDTIAQKKSDYAIAFSSRYPDIRAYYNVITFGGKCLCLSQMADTYSRMLALLLAIEVKIEGGNAMEARFQLALWFTAGLRCIRELARVATKDASIMDEVPIFGWTVVGHTWDLYVAFVDDGRSGAVRIAGPLEGLTVNTRTYTGVFKLYALISRMKSYGREGYWPRLKTGVLEPLIQTPISSESAEEHGDDGEAGDRLAGVGE